jgi:hypothetical protein
MTTFLVSISNSFPYFNISTMRCVHVHATRGIVRHLLRASLLSRYKSGDNVIVSGRVVNGITEIGTTYMKGGGVS